MLSLSRNTKRHVNLLKIFNLHGGLARQGPNMPCDYTNYKNYTGVTPVLLSSWKGIEVCGPAPTTDHPVQFIPNPNNTTELEFECPELVKRYLLLLYGLPSVMADGFQVVDAYTTAYPNLLKKITPDMHIFPNEGDVLSYGTTDPGHTSIVIKVKNKDATTGSADVTVIEQNIQGLANGTETMHMSGWQMSGIAGTVASWMTFRTWSVSPSPTWKHNYATSLNSISATSSTDAWAVGQGLIERWHNNKWQIQSTPYGFNFLGVASITSTDVWAVGDVGNQTLTEHWDGSTWGVVPSPNFGDNDILYSVSVVSSTDVWAVGASCFSDGQCQTLTEQWNGSQWSIVSSPNGAIGGVNVLNAVTVISSSDIWAVGTDVPLSGPSQTLTMNWNGSQWTIQSSPSPDSISNTLTGVSGGSSSDVWAVGYTGGSNAPLQTLIEYWNGTQWTVVSSPNVGTDAVLNAVVERSVNDVWAVGYDDNGSQSSSTFILHCYLWGSPSTPCQWNVIPSPNSKAFPEHKLLGVALIPNPSWEVWAVGVEYNNQILTFQPLIERFS